MGIARYNESKFLARVLSPLVGNRGHIMKNSKVLQTCTLHWRKEITASFTVEAFYKVY